MAGVIMRKYQVSMNPSMCQINQKATGANDFSVLGKAHHEHPTPKHLVFKSELQPANPTRLSLFGSGDLWWLLTWIWMPNQIVLRILPQNVSSDASLRSIFENGGENFEDYIEDIIGRVSWQQESDLYTTTHLLKYKSWMLIELCI
ncbi:hypothetical protein E2542_SST09171 [Spatholobus suberectus]|nr:hypothetical protein E2542_SST09171 [Spatholobus suberectus]